MSLQPLEAQMQATLTEKLLRSLLGKSGESIRDQVLIGLEARPRKRSITFSAVGRLRGSGIRQPIRVQVGQYPMLLLAELRDRARLVLRDLHDGIDPRALKAKRLRVEAAERENRFSVVAERFILRMAGVRTARAIELRIRRELIARWGERSIASITRVEVSDMVLEIAGRGHREAARQSLVYARRLFRWAIARGLLEHAPTDHLSGKDLIGPKNIRQRLLTERELRLIWRAAAEARYPNGPYIQLLVLLGVRRSELGQAPWSELDLDQALWTISPARMKSNEGHTVPLPPRAVKILGALPRFASGYVFAARGTKPLNDFGEVKRLLDLRVTELNGGRPIDPWTLHDLRRTFRTALSSLGVAPHIAELCLAHRQPGLARTYDLHRFDREKRDALNAWAARLLANVEPPPPNVVRLRSQV
jgi:integrase